MNAKLYNAFVNENQDKPGLVARAKKAATLVGQVVAQDGAFVVKGTYHVTSEGCSCPDHSLNERGDNVASDGRKYCKHLLAVAFSD